MFKRNLALFAGGLSIALLAVCHAQSANQWRQLAPLEGGTALALLSEGARVYAGTATRGVFVSTDNGKTWREANNGLGNLVVNALAAAGGNVLAATNAGIYRSGDGGQNWTHAGLGNQQVFSFSVTNVGVFAGSDLRRVYRSSDNGQSWAERGQIPLGTASFVTALAFVGDALLAGTTFGFFRSTNQGQSWTQVTAGLPNAGFASVSALAVNGNTVYLGASLAYRSGGAFLPQVYSSDNGGQNWSAVGQTISVALNSTISDAPGVRALTFDGASLYASTVEGLFVYNGQNWSEPAGGRGLPVGVRVNAFTRSGGITLLGTDGGVYAGDGQSWNASNTGLTAVSVSALAVSGASIFVSVGPSGLFRSGDDGQSWTAINNVDNGNGRRFTVQTLAARGAAIYAGTDWGGVFRSNDNGASWTQLDGGLRFVAFAPDVAFSGPADTDAVYALASGFVHKLNPDGQSWMPTHTDQLRTTGRLAVSGVNVYVATDRYVARSTDGGVNFAAVRTQATLISSQCVVARDNQVYFGGEAIEGLSTYRLFASNDNGASFTASRSILPANAIVFGNNTLYASTPADGVYFSGNQGSNWTPVNAGLPTRAVTTLAVKGETLLAGTNGYGVFAATNPRTQSANLANVSAASFSADARLASESIVSAFGAALATGTVAATTSTLPVSLQGTRVTVRDSTGTERRAPLFFVSPSQINYQIPAGAAAGDGVVIVSSGDGSSSFGNVRIASVAPGLFAANASGQGVAAAVALRVKADGAQVFEPVARFDSAQNRFVAAPIDLGPDLGAATDQVFLILFGTGLRFRSSLAAVNARIGGTDAQVTAADAQGQFVGLDQINVRLPRSLIGRGNVDVTLIVDGQMANVVGVNFK